MVTAQVVVIGSGIAAMAAARDLSRKGIKVLILEAMHRIGGRIHTVEVGNRRYDLGASWMHETLTNPLFRVAAEQGIEMEYDDAKYEYFTAEGKVDARERTHKVEEDLYKLIYLDYCAGKARRPEVSFKDYAIEFAKTWPLLSDFNREHFARYAQTVELWTAMPWDGMAASSAILDFDGRNAFVTGGMSRIYDWVSDQVNWDNVEMRVNSKVTQVEKDGSGSFVVTIDGDETVTSDYVLCTVALGGLQLSWESIFKVDIPAPLATAMSVGVMGALGKVVLEYESQWWIKGVDQTFYVSDKDANEDLPMEPGNHPINLLMVYSEYKKLPVLMALTAPPLTQYIEKNPEEVERMLGPALESIRVDFTLPVPRAQTVLVTDWTQNPLFNGSYSGIKLGQTYNEMVEPFIEGADRLRFAGEHTTYDGNGCVHGSYATGIREAGWIMDDIESNE